MPAHSLQDLADQLCAVTGANVPSLEAGADGLLAFSIKVRGVDVTVTHDPVEHGDEAAVYIFFGTLPTDREGLAAEALLRANLQMRSPRAPSFGLDEQRREVVLKYAYPLSSASGHGLCGGLEAIAETALRWRENHFIDVVEAMAEFGQFA